MRAFTFLFFGTASVLFWAAGCDGQQEIATKSMVSPSEKAETPGVETHTYSRSSNPSEAGGRLEAHEHGHGRLAIAVDREQVTFTFEAPLASLVGFEHEAETPEQQAALDALKDAFVVPGNMVAINGQASCLPITTSSGTHISDGHGALEVEHVYSCDNPAAIETVEFLMMGSYPSLESIEAIYASQTTQSAAQLRPGNTVLEVH
ncbi:DUF2796 domain-containing protein [Henriciella sp.]|uniref:ZrgA family zinc uptake protein n=1 Tax=Henriciella sp. TaxID=1968823 RepID=UPI00261A2141|nr:DUF2796 domain-containing protein [Henriciella sp.]